MPLFTGFDFEVELPADVRDESTYAFAFPARANFRPSLVIKTERLNQAVTLEEYVEKQLQTIKGLLANVSVVSVEPMKHGGLEAYTSVYDWGDPGRRVRQKQRYILLDPPLRVITLTATGLQETFGYLEELFDAVFLSFRPLDEVSR